MYKKSGLDYGNGKSVTVWQSFDGRKFRGFEEMTHQHLCNIYYWTHIVNPDWYDQALKNKIKTSIDKYFDGELLEYKPLNCFRLEMETLQDRGWLKEEGGDTKVVVDGKFIGSVDFKTFL